MSINSPYFAAVAFVLIPAVSVAQESALPPSRRLIPLCGGFAQAMGDLTELSKAIVDKEEASGAMNMASVAQLAGERCTAVHSLLFVFELLPSGPSRAKAGEYIAFRKTQYAALFKTDITYANHTMGVTQLPGLARQAESLRDRMRSLVQLLPTLPPN